MRKLITTKNAIILIIVLLCFFLVLLIRQLLIQYLSNNDNPIIWFALALGLAIFFLGQIRKYLITRKRKSSIITSRIPELNRLFGVVDDNLFYILEEIDTIVLPDDLTNEVKVTCQGFQKVLFNQKDRIHTLENELYWLPNSRCACTPAEGRDLATTIDSIDNAIVDQLDLMHNLVMKLQKLKDNDENIALASVLLNESGANILNVYANIKHEFRLISGNIKEVKDNNKSKERVMKEVTKEKFKAIYLKYFKPDQGWDKGQWKKYYRKPNMRYFVQLPENSKEDRMMIVDGGNEVRLFFMTVDREEAFFDYPGKE